MKTTTKENGCVLIEGNWGELLLLPQEAKQLYWLLRATGDTKEPTKCCDCEYLKNDIIRKNSCEAIFTRDRVSTLEARVKEIEGRMIMLERRMNKCGTLSIFNEVKE